MAGHKGGRRDVYVKVVFQDPHHGEAGRHQSGLCILGQRQIFNRAIGHQAGQILAQGRIDLVKDSLGAGEVFGKLLAHANGLRALTWKNKGEFHLNFLP